MAMMHPSLAYIAASMTMTSISILKSAKGLKVDWTFQKCDRLRLFRQIEIVWTCNADGSQWRLTDDDSIAYCRWQTMKRLRSTHHKEVKGRKTYIQTNGQTDDEEKEVSGKVFYAVSLSCYKLKPMNFFSKCRKKLTHSVLQSYCWMT